MTRDQILRRFAAELIGTFTLVFAGCGAIVANTLSNGAVTHIGISLTFGLVVMAMVAATGHLSGAHLNPAVTLAFAATRHVPWRLVPVYWAAQFMGALVAGLVLRALFGEIARLGATVPNGPAAQSFVLEIVLTFFLMFVIMAVATDRRATGIPAAMAIGGTVALDALFGGPISGASMNPARSLGPALAAGGAPDQWVYFVGPVAGAILAAFAYEILRGRPDLPVPTDDRAKRVAGTAIKR